MRLFVGTSGFSYPGWKGALYPKAAKPKDFLRLYAEKFETVELNATFYRMPTAGMLEGFRKTVGGEFVFAVKAHRSITHLKRLKDVGEKVPDFFAELEPLRDRLGPILFQLPPNMKFDPERMRGFLPLVRDAAQVALEFRHPSFFEPEALALLAESSAAIVLSDEEEAIETVVGRAPSLPKASFSYVRLRQESYDDRELAPVLELLEKRGGNSFLYVKHEVTGPALVERIRKLAERG